MTVSESTEFSVSSSKHDPYSFISSPASPAEAPAINLNGKNFMPKEHEFFSEGKRFCLIILLKMHVIGVSF